MRIQIISDVHLETQPGFRASPADNADVLVLAGDVGSYQRGSKLLAGKNRDFGLGQFAAASAGGRWSKVIYVPGNHEYDRGDYDSIHGELREVSESLGMIWLEKETYVYEGVRFVGTTLWTDFDALAAKQPDYTGVLRHRAKAYRAANFYLTKAEATRYGQPLLAEGWRELGIESQKWLRGTLAVPFDGTTVVVTHFAPSLRSADPRYGLTPGTAGFCNDLDDELIAAADFWIHGHLHCHNDYSVTVGGRSCRVIGNPLGYASKGEQDSFVADLCIEVHASTR